MTKVKDASPNAAGQKLLPLHTERQVRLEFQAPPGSEVFVAGSFNAWNPRQIRLKEHPVGGVFTTTLTLPHDRHEYKFIVNGEWRVDPSCPNWAMNEHGSLNSVLVV